MLIREAGLAFTLLTRLPAARLAGSETLPAARAVWAFPLAGAAVGACGALVLAVGSALHTPSLLAACWALASMVMMSGALHEDGLADLADGFGGGATRERKLAIMRDSRIGSYGALALVLSCAIRIASIATLADRPIVLVAIGALGRGSIAVPLLLLEPVRSGGLGATMAGAGNRRWTCLFLAVLAGAALPAASSAALAAAMAVTALAWVQIGGFTGDVLGGCEVCAECAALTALTCT